jgi:cation:H+ antiporter
MFESLSLTANLAAFAASGAVVWFAGSGIARCADAVARRTDFGEAAIGILLLGAVTSLPELAVAVTATLEGHPALSVGDVLGSASINLLILALADAVLGRKALTSTLPSTRVLLQGVLSTMLFVVAAGAAVTGDAPFLGMGVGSWLLVAGYAVCLRILIVAGDRKSWVPARRPRTKADSHAREQDDTSAGALAAKTAGFAALILAGGFVLAQSAAAIAAQTGLGANIVGTVMLAAATSLPEISTVVAAVRLKRYEMAISDIFGTNLFNVTIIAVVDALHPGPPVLGEIGAFAAFAALLAGLLTLVFVVGALERRDRTVLRMGYDSLAAIVVYLAGIAVLYQLR